VNHKCNCRDCLKREALKGFYVALLLAIAAGLIGIGYYWPR
jgi:hypothetical protein